MSERFRIVVMGVSGSGKSTIGEQVARLLHAQYLDADDAHPQANIDKMAAGNPLTDDDRWPWLDHLHDALAASERIVVTCSALKRSYRDVLRRVEGVEFAYLEVEPSTVRERIGDREGHFMKADMVDSQFATLEPPSPDETDVTTFDGRTSPESLVDEVIDRLAPPTR